MTTATKAIKVVGVKAIGVKGIGAKVVSEIVTYRRIAKMLVGGMPSGGNGVRSKGSAVTRAVGVAADAIRDLENLTASQLELLDRQQENIERKERIEERLDAEAEQQADEYTARVEEYLGMIKALPVEDRRVVKMAYIFSQMVPREDREDVFQELAVKLYESKPTTDALAYTVARCDWKNWWRDIKRYHGFVDRSLNELVENDDGGVVEFGELLVGEVEFEKRVDGKIDGQAIYKSLPTSIKLIVGKRLRGHGITSREREALDAFTAKSGLLAR